MRISDAEVKNIVESIESHVQLKDAELRLYGSRVNEKAKGGDIDLLLIVADNDFQHALDAKYAILSLIKKSLGDQKIDFLIIKFSQLSKDPFVKLIYPGSLLIKKW